MDAMARPRARQAGVPFPGEPGQLNAITDVAGVEVGHTTLISGDGPLRVGQGPVRTGVTVVLPVGRQLAAVPAAFFALNGTGELTGAHTIRELGLLYGPVALTNTLSVGAVHEGVLRWMAGAFDEFEVALPVVGECYDGELSDIRGFHVRPEHVLSAVDDARPGPVAEGSVGAGTGTIAFEFKAGIGSSSRRVDGPGGAATVGVLVQANCAARHQLLLGGVPAGHLGGAHKLADADGKSSIVVVIAVDAPLDAVDLARVARRGPMGLARTGATAGAFSGDLFLAFSTQAAATTRSVDVAEPMVDELRNALFEATVQATEEAVINSLFASTPMTGIDGATVEALDIDEVTDLLRRHGRLTRDAPR